LKQKVAHPFYASAAWRAVRQLALKRDRWMCVQCSAKVHTKGSMIVDHIIERKARPDLALTLTNLRTLCRKCDAMRHRNKYLGGGQPGWGGNGEISTTQLTPDHRPPKEISKRDKPSPRDFLASNLLDQLKNRST
jgi:hypothetical protein